MAWVVAALFLLAIADALVDGRNTRRLRKARRALKRAPRMAMGAVKNGDWACVSGRARPRAPLKKSPLSQRDCIGFRVMVERFDVGSAVWQLIIDLEDFVTFSLADGTGEAVVHAPFVVMLDPHDERGDDLPPAFFDLLERERWRRTGPSGGEYLFRYTETLLLPDDDIVALGRATIEIDPAGRARSHREPPVMCHLRGGEIPVVIAEPDVADRATAS